MVQRQFLSWGRFLKKWCSLSRSADPARIFLSKTNGGLDIPSITTCLKKAQVSRYSQLMSSTDSTCHFLTECKHTRDTGTHKKLKPTEEVMATMKEYPNATRKKRASEACKQIAENDEKALVNHASSLVKESHLFAIKEKGDELWDDTLTEYHFAALQHGRYNTRHDRVLQIIYQHMQENLPKVTTVVVDLGDRPYQLSADLPTDLRPDLVVLSPGCLHIFELTVCWEANFLSSQLRKESKYLHLGGGTEQRDSQPTHHPSWMQGVHRHQEPPVTLRTVPSKPKGSEGSDETDQQSHD